ncbi:MAG: head-tail connector protein [Collimonas pratensis]|uniref:head-tail connector protein n=1 Tax=Collimonas pratensis TaxID=279113 RepID=UPI003C746C43
MITLQEAKEHMKVDDDIHDDAEITAMIATAHAHIENYLERTFSAGDDVPAPIKSAALLLVGELYEYREAQADVALYTNRTFSLLLNPYRTMAI